jgi:hypothetical protein
MMMVQLSSNGESFTIPLVLAGSIDQVSVYFIVPKSTVTCQERLIMNALPLYYFSRNLFCRYHAHFYIQIMGKIETVYQIVSIRVVFLLCYNLIKE